MPGGSTSVNISNDYKNTRYRDPTFSVLENVFVVLLNHMHESRRQFGRIRTDLRVMPGAATHSRRRDVISRRMVDEHHLKRVSTVVHRLIKTEMATHIKRRRGRPFFPIPFERHPFQARSPK